MVVLRRSASSGNLLESTQRRSLDPGPPLTRSRSLPSVLKLLTRLFDPHRRRSLPERPKPRVIVLGSGGRAPRTEKPKDKRKKRSSWLPDPDRRWPIQGW